MAESEIEVAIWDDGVFVQRWPCTRVAMPDGSPGVLWRGVAYKLRVDGTINLSPGETTPERPAQGAARYAALPGEEASWVLLQGLPAALDAARRKLESGGVEVSRGGRWLGEPVGGVGFDWFLRCVGSIPADQVAALLGPPDTVAPTDDSPARVAVLEQRIADLVAELARLHSMVEQVAAPTVGADDTPSEPDPALYDALEVIRSLQAQLEERPRPAAQVPPVAIRLQEELASALEGLRPDVRMLRDSLLVVVGEYRSRGGFYRAVHDLPPSGSRPDGWKALAGTEKWWERHVSTGQDNTGRAYARFDASVRRWSLLIGWKAEQARDIAWLRKQG